MVSKPGTEGNRAASALPPPEPPSERAAERRWKRFGWLLLALALLAQLLYVAGGTVELSEDEAYYWLWSKKPALAYYSKPPLVAFTIALGTRIWGDTELGVRFFSPVIGVLVALLMFRFFIREVGARAGVALLLLLLTTPLLSVGATLMTIDPLSALFWTMAALAGWRAVGPTGTTRDWLGVGVWMGLGALSKYVALLQPLCWACVFWLLPSTRRHLRRSGPWLALAIQLLFLLPVLVWNARHGWPTLTHVSQRLGLGGWTPGLRYPAEFLASELALLHPVYSVAACLAVLGLGRGRTRDPRAVYFFCMGTPLFLLLLVTSLGTRVQPNWIAPAIVPILAGTVLYWRDPWCAGVPRVRRWAAVGLLSGLAAVVVLHDTDWIEGITGRPLPARLDPLRRVRGWSDTARVVARAREELLAEGRSVFVVAPHYGLASQLSFYLPAARAVPPGERLVFTLPSRDPHSQFYFWPGYRDRQGENAVYASVVDPSGAAPATPPGILLSDFGSVTDLGLHPVRYRGRTLRWIRLFACRDLRPRTGAVDRPRASGSSSP